MDELDMQEFITDALHFYNEENEDDKIKSIDSFRRAMILTTNKGLVITMKDGSAFQITIVQTELAE